MSATITDSDGIAWANGTFSVTFVPKPGAPGPYVYNGSTMTNAQKGPYTGVMNGSGAMTVNLPDNTFITPTGSQWLFTLCPNASSSCSAVQTSVSGATLNLTSLFSSSVVAPRFPATGVGQYGYSDIEVNQIPTPGGNYFNVLTGNIRYWTGSLFQNQLIAGSNPVFTSITTSKVDGWFYVDGVTYTTPQQAFTAACAAGGGTVYISPGTYAQNTPFVLCNNLNIIGAGTCQADAGTCPTTITTTITTGDLFPIVNVTDGSVYNIGIKNIGAGGGNAFRRLSAQRWRLRDIYISGPFAGGNWYTSSSIAAASTIWNTDDNIHCTGLQNGSVATKFDATDATTKVINGNRIWNDHCTAGTGGVALLLTNSNQAQQINENIIECSECSAPSGTGIQFDQGATLDTILLLPNSENNSTCFSKATANSVIVLGGHLQSCTTKVTDNQPSASLFLNTSVQGVLPNLGITPIGGAYFDSIGLGGQRPSSIALDGFIGITGLPGWCLETSPPTCRWQVNAGSFNPNTAGGSDVGTSSLPVGNIFLGNAATNNEKIQSDTMTAARVLNLPDAPASLVQVAKVPSDVTNNSTTFSNITGLSFPAVANRNYRLVCDLLWQTDTPATGGLKLQVTGPAAATNVILESEIYSNITANSGDPIGINTTTVLSLGTALNGAAAAKAAATNYIARLFGTIENGANSGTFQTQFAEQGAGTATIKRGSTCSLTITN